MNQSKRFRFWAATLAAAVTVVSAVTAHAQCCSGYSPATVCSGVAMTKSRWCIQDSVPTGQNALPKAFCSYGDKVVSTLEQVFNIPAPDTFEFDLETQTGGAHTGTDCGNFGDTVAYDAFTGTAYQATSFWGYLLSLHEAINDWTGMSSPGWPTDWWADHQSAFPNLMDFRIMNTIGVANSDQNLTTAATAQKARFYPGGDSADPKVVALDNVYNAMPGGDGYAGFSKMFALQKGDGLNWDNLGVPNPDVKRSEYVAAYMSLAARQAVLPILQGPGVNGGGDICNDVQDSSGDAPYTCSEADIDAIATAHCSIVANGNPASDLSALQAGNYSNIPSGPCGSTCPAECACDGPTQHCVPPWLATTGGGGTGGGGASGAGGSPGSTGGASAAGGSAASSGGTGAGGTGAGGTSSGGTSSGAGSGAGGGAPGGGTSNGGSTSGTARSSGNAGSNGGCGCRAAGQRQSDTWLAGLLAAALLGMSLGRSRER